MKPKLISFKLCPFVQRSIITLLYKKVDFDIEYIDLANKPKWFLKISPLGKVPVMQIGDDVLFESAVINEYLDEVNPPALHPNDSLQKAKNRAWIEFGSGLLMDIFQMSVGDEKVFQEKKKIILEKLKKIVVKGDFFNGSEFSLVDAAYAPALQRLDLFDRHLKLGFLGTVPKIEKWSKNLMNLDAVKNSVVDNFEDLFVSFIKDKNGYMASMFN